MFNPPKVVHIFSRLCQNGSPLYLMWFKQCHKPSPSHHHFYRWYAYYSQSWVVYDIVLPTFVRNGFLKGSIAKTTGFNAKVVQSQVYDCFNHIRDISNVPSDQAPPAWLDAPLTRPPWPRCRRCCRWPRQRSPLLVQFKLLMLVVMTLTVTVIWGFNDFNVSKSPIVTPCCCTVLIPWGDLPTYKSYNR